MRKLSFVLACLLISTTTRAQLTDFAANKGILIADSPTFFVAPPDQDFFSLPAKPAHIPWTQFLQQLNTDPRRHSFWIRLGLRNTSGADMDCSLDYGELDYIDLIVSRGGDDSLARIKAHGLSSVIQGGMLRRPPPGASYLQRESNLLPVRLPASSVTRLTIRIRQRTDEYNFDGLALYDAGTLAADFVNRLPQDRSWLIIQMLFQGFLLCQLIYALFQWLIIRRPEYRYYLIYMTLILLYFLSKQESLFGVTILFSRYPLLKVWFGKTLLILPYFVYFRFIRSFLEMPANYPALNKWIIRVERFLLLYAAADLLFICVTFDRKTQTAVYTTVFTAVFLLTIGFMIYMYRHRQTLIYYVISGSLFVATGHILGLLFSYLEIDRHIDLGVPDIFVFPQAGIVLEVLCFTAGLSYKSQKTEQEKIAGQERLIEQLQANELLQARMQHIRNKIAQDLHDDIGSTLSSISILSNLAIQGNSNTQALQTMNEIKDSSMLLMERMDDIVWSINPRNDSLDNLLMRIRHFATTLFEARGIDYFIDIQ
ncbi:MAG TPA: 7TM-DISM domain-containing protein, partial [Puia sp.]|nr:7TM-DISM domain-containing protein [Puia sp.]